MPNELIDQKSPYLLQHAHNPVHWYAWSSRAFEKSRAENKPIFLSVGYSTCHWCHVMEEESFTDSEIARILNESFISIKVDREERPDIDQLYMQYLTATTGRGGWPMSIFLTPTQEPFYGGTYFPKENRYGMMGFKSLLEGISEAWKNRREEILESSRSAAGYLKSASKAEHAHTHDLTAGLFDHFFDHASKSFDENYGGFGSAPKFPRSESIRLLLRHWKKKGESRALEMAQKTLTQMALGGIHDHVGGGFHRYSTDQAWFLPHFEKMLYDQALVTQSYLELYQATGQKEYADVVEKTLNFVMGNEFRSPEGAFYSAIDADSSEGSDRPAKKKEGAYYVWRADELGRILGDKADLFCEKYGVKPDGNVAADPHHEFEEKNVLFLSGWGDKEAFVSSSDLESLKKAREQFHPKPQTDQKVLLDWNALMISAFCVGARVLRKPEYLQVAIESAEFIESKMVQQNQLYHRYCDGQTAIRGMLSDYAAASLAWLDLFESTLDQRWADRAFYFADEMLKRFWDETEGVFFMNDKEQIDLFTRPKDSHDGACPSGQSMAYRALHRLAIIFKQNRFEPVLLRIEKEMACEWNAAPTAYPYFLMTLYERMFGVVQIQLATKAKALDIQDWLEEIYLRFLPNKIIMLRMPEVGHSAVEEGAMICLGSSCLPPAKNLKDLVAQFQQIEHLERKNERG